MSKRLQVLDAVEALVRLALPNADVVSLDNDEPAPTKLAPGGRVVIRTGDPGPPEMTLGILTYTYFHRIPLELVAYPSGELSRERVLDEMAGKIGAEVEIDRTLGGLVNWLEPEAMTTDDVYTAGAQAAREGDLALVAEYDTNNPLT